MKLTNEQIKKADDSTICIWIGEEIFGWEQTTYLSGRTAWILQDKSHCSFDPLVSHGFTHNMSEAWNVLTMFIPTALRVELTGREDQYKCYIDYFPREYEAYYRTPARAICEVALMAKDELRRTE